MKTGVFKSTILLIQSSVYPSPDMSYVCELETLIFGEKSQLIQPWSYSHVNMKTFENKIQY